MTPKLDLRPSPIAGQWYPADPNQLAESIDNYLNHAHLPDIEGEIIAVMTPHAGHRYSGPVAAYAFNALRGMNLEVAVVVSPMHHYFDQPLLTTAHEAYLTPLGPMMVDKDVMAALEENLQLELGYGLTPIKNDPEHSLEIELPFLQRVLGAELRLLPIMVREVSVRFTHSLGVGLAKTLQGQNAILVASTDLSHFYPQSRAEKLDAEILRRVESFNPEGVLHAQEEGVGFACGRGALASVMWAAKDLGANHAQILQYATSGDITHDYSQVVGYAAGVFTRK